MRTGLIAALQSYTQAIPQMAVAGQDPTQVVTKIAQVIKSRQKGQAIEDAVSEIFAPQQVPPAGANTQVEQPSPAPSTPVGGQPQEAGMGQMGQPQQGGPQIKPQTIPDIQSLLSSLSSSGSANASVRTIRRSR